MATPAERFLQADASSGDPDAQTTTAARATRRRTGRRDWVARRASADGVVCVNWQQVCLGDAAAGRTIDVWVTDQVLQFYDGDELLRTEKRDQHRGGESQTSPQAHNGDLK